MRVKAVASCALVVALAAFAQARPAITDNIDVKFDDWMTPSKPAYPHDPAVAPDGSIWYTAQRASTIGRFDPATQQFKEFALPTPNSGPHGLQPDANGNIWYTGNAAGRVDGVVEMAEVAGLFAESTGDVGVGPFLEGRHAQRETEDK